MFCLFCILFFKTFFRVVELTKNSKGDISRIAWTRIYAFLICISHGKLMQEVVVTEKAIN